MADATMTSADAPYDVYGDLERLLNIDKDPSTPVSNRVFLWDYQGSFVVSGLIVGDFTLGGSSDWSFDGKGGAIVDSINSLLNAGTGTGNSMSAASRYMGNFGGIGNGVTKPQVRSPWQSVVDWKSSGDFSLSFDMLFLSLTPNEDAREAVFHLMRCVYPEIALGGTMVIPPLQYVRMPFSAALESSAAGIWGCVGLKIGNWFETPPVFVVDSASFSMSKEQIRTADGSVVPLYANGNVRVRCSHAVGVSHLKSWMNLPDSVLGV